MDLLSKMIEGNELTPGEVVKLKRTLRAKPDDLDCRLLLLGYLCLSGTRKNSEYQNHLEWLIRNYPDDEFVFGPLILVRKDEYFQSAKRQWKKALKAAPQNLQILINAAEFCRYADPGFSEVLLRRGQLQEPENERWCFALTKLYSRMARDKSLAKDRASFRKAMEQARESLCLHKKYPRRSYLQVYMGIEVGDWVNLALFFGDIETAKFFGERLVDFANSSIVVVDEDGKAHGYKHLAHKGYSILGRVALANQDIEEAKKLLSLMPAQTFGSLQDLTLAGELLKLNEAASVITYLKACEQFITSRLHGFIEGREEIPYFYHALCQEGNPKSKIKDFLKNRLKVHQEKIANWIETIEGGGYPELNDPIGIHL